jgi:hypothetical protein
MRLPWPPRSAVTGADGRHELADAISAATYTFEDRERGDGGTPAPPPVAARKYEPPPGELAA